MRILSTITIVTVFTFLSSCGNGDGQFDATGNFEATEVLVGAEGSGKLMRLDIEEGRELKSGEVIGYIDTTQLHLRRRQLEYSVSAVLARRPDAATQLSTISEQLQTAERERARIERLLKADAATPKQLDDMNAQIDLLKKQYAATRSTLDITTRSLQSETLPLKAQLEQVIDQIRKSVVVNPVNGTVLTQYALSQEVVAPGKALYKIADLSVLKLRAYITGTQLPMVKIGQQVTVSVDDGSGGYKTYKGTISWISDKAEFTPKTIQTKEERANLVYPVKISVPNDGYLKIGMYGEVKF